MPPPERRRRCIGAEGVGTMTTVEPPDRTVRARFAMGQRMTYPFG